MPDNPAQQLDQIVKELRASAGSDPSWEANRELKRKWADALDALLPPVREATRRHWECFHCGEVFTTPSAARDHFGETPNAVPGCLIDRVALEEGGQPERGRGLLMALRKQEAENAELRTENEQLDHMAGAYQSMVDDFKRRWPQHGGSAIMAYDFMEGRALAAEERADKAEADLRLALEVNKRNEKPTSRH